MPDERNDEVTRQETGTQKKLKVIVMGGSVFELPMEDVQGMTVRELCQNGLIDIPEADLARRTIQADDARITMDDPIQGNEYLTIQDRATGN